MKINLCHPCHCQTNMHSDAVHFKKDTPLWDKASQNDIDNFKTELDSFIKNIVIDVDTLSCNDVQCSL